MLIKPIITGTKHSLTMKMIISTIIVLTLALAITKLSIMGYLIDIDVTDQVLDLLSSKHSGIRFF